MIFWLVTAAVVAVGFALAWWSSGRAKPAPGHLQERSRRRQVEGKIAEIRPDLGTPKGGPF
jgi:hypothetical protein